MGSAVGARRKSSQYTAPADSLEDGTSGGEVWTSDRSDRDQGAFDPVSKLRRVPLFKKLDSAKVAELASACQTQEYQPGEILAQDGEVGREFFMVCQGEAKCTTIVEEGCGFHEKVRTLKRGDYVGEKMLLYDVSHTATIVALESLKVLKITQKDFKDKGFKDLVGSNKRVAIGGGGANLRVEAPAKKTPEERQAIINALRQNPNLSNCVTLDDEAANAMADVCWKENVSKGQIIIKRGDIRADYFYVVDTGEFQILKKDPVPGWDSEKNAAYRRQESLRSSFSESGKVPKVSSGSSFGELALLCLAPRSATVQATEDSTVWVFDRVNFKRILLRSSDQKIAQFVKLVENIEIMKDLPSDDRRKIAEALVETHFAQGEDIMKQGELGNSIYVLVEGEVVVIVDDAEVKTIKAPADLKDAPFFGERSLLTDEPRSATIRVQSEHVKALALDRESFNIVLERHDEDPSRKDFSSSRQVSGSPVDTPRSSKMSTYSSIKVSKSISKKGGFPRIPKADLQMVGILGCGAFGIVSLYEHKESKDCYALKSVSKGYVVMTQMQETTINEKNVMLACDSDWIIRLYETYNTAQTLDYLMELALGGELHQLYRRENLFGQEDFARYYAAGMVCALEHLHSIRVVYRDLKPENILLNDKGHVKLTDMGLAKFIMGQTYTTCGTPDYFAPEVVASTGHSFGVDWWTLGILIFELMAGHAPFEADNPMDTFALIRKGVLATGVIPNKFKKPLKDLIKGLLKPDPSMRLPMLSGGVKNIMEQKWFAGASFDWDAFRDLSMAPPYVPNIKDNKDMSNFNKDYELPEQLPYTDDGTGWDAEFATM